MLNTNHQAPIGIFDSGVGGLSIAKRVRALLPHENLVYIADSAHAPYGDKSQDFILQRSRLLTGQLLERQCKLIVVACNTATVNTIHRLREQFAMPFVGVEPGIKPAIQVSRSGVIGVLATQRTLDSESFDGLHERFADQARFIIQPCPGLVEKVETMDLTGAGTRQLLAQYIEPLLDAGVDTLVLGCTHYPFLLEAIQAVAGNEVRVVDTSRAVAEQVGRLLAAENLLADESGSGAELFLCSGETEPMSPVINGLWGARVQLLKLP